MAKKKKVGSKIKKVSKNNPNKVNQYTDPDPRQALFLSKYLNPDSPTFANALQSALKAGYSQEYAGQLTSQMPKWLLENLRKPQLLKKAENNIGKFLSDDYIDNDKIKADITKFTLSNLGKHWNKGSQHESKERLVNVELNIRNLIQGEKQSTVEVIDQVS